MQFKNFHAYLWNTNLTETQIFRELSIKLVGYAIQI